jgi:hypothetical protein
MTAFADLAGCSGAQAYFALTQPDAFSCGILSPIRPWRTLFCAANLFRGNASEKHLYQLTLTSPPLAPSAIRTPVACVRCETKS